MTQQDVLIVGAGLSGLTIATRLHRAGIAVRLLEARPQIGGRIRTVADADGNGAFDLGPAWFWAHHTHVQQLMRDLDVAAFVQHARGAGVYDHGAGQPPQLFQPPPMATAYRFVGGVQQLIQRLAAQLPAETIQLATVVKSITQVEGQIEISAETANSPQTFNAKQVVVTLPPHLIAETLTFTPPLPQPLTAAMRNTMTWMGQAMKVVLMYEQPFWRSQGLSGFGFSHVGPVNEFRDHCSADGTVAALFGWVGDFSHARQLTPEVRRAAIITQAVRLFGAQAAAPLHYAECNWAQERFTTPPDQPLQTAAEHPQYGHPLLQEAAFGGQLYWASTETAAVNGGYLDGAIYRGEQVAQQIIAQR